MALAPRRKLVNTSFGAAALDDATFHAGFPDSLFERLSAFGIGGRGQVITDVGSGIGSLARGFARRGSRVIGVEPDERLVEQARQLDAQAQVAVEYALGTAESLPLGDRTMDVVTAGECWHCFEGPRAASEMARVLRWSGRAVIAHFDWLPVAGSAVEATERLIKKHNPAWRMGGCNGFHPESIPDLAAAGFKEFESFSYDVDVPYTPEAWRGRVRAGVGAALSPAALAAFDIELARLLKESYPGPMLAVPHRVFALLARLARAV